VLPVVTNVPKFASGVPPAVRVNVRFDIFSVAPDNIAKPDVPTVTLLPSVVVPLVTVAIPLGESVPLPDQFCVVPVNRKVASVTLPLLTKFVPAKRYSFVGEAPLRVPFTVRSPPPVTVWLASTRRSAAARMVTGPLSVPVVTVVSPEATSRAADTGVWGVIIDVPCDDSLPPPVPLSVPEFCRPTFVIDRVLSTRARVAPLATAKPLPPAPLDTLILLASVVVPLFTNVNDGEYDPLPDQFCVVPVNRKVASVTLPLLTKFVPAN
jgi:hypothetical protein